MVTSPNVLNSPAGAGVRRLNRRPFIIVGAFVSLLLIAIAYTYHTRLAEQARLAAGRLPPAEPVGEPAILKGAPENGLILPPAPEPQPPRAEVQPQVPPPLVVPEEPAPEPTDPYAEEWERYRAAQARLRQARQKAAEDAIRAPTTLRNFAPQAKSEAPAAAEATESAPGQLASRYALEALSRRASTTWSEI